MMDDQATTDQQAQKRRYKSSVAYQINIQEKINHLTRPSKSREVVPLGYHPSYDVRVIRHASLLDQLRVSVSGAPGHPSGGTSAFGSRAPIRLDALDTLTLIDKASRVWVSSLGGKVRATVEGNLWFLSGSTVELDVEVLDRLEGDVRSWEVGAAVTSGWDAPAWRPHVPCPACDESDTLRVRAEKSEWGWSARAYCVSCATGWDRSNIGILGNHIELMLEERAEFMAAVRAELASANLEPHDVDVPAVLRGVAPGRSS